MEIITTRLKIREFNSDDLDALLQMDLHPLVNRFEPGTLTPEDIRYRLEGALEWAAEIPRKIYKLAITIPPDDCLRGRITLKHSASGDEEWMLGWTLHPDYWGKGYASEAALSVLNFAFSELHAHRVSAYCHADNSASIRVMERIGMKFEGRMRERIFLDGRWYDELVYGILVNEILLS